MVAILAGMFNIFAARRLPFFEGIMFLVFFGGLFAILIPLWVLAPTVSSKTVWTNFEIWSGWANLGVACAIGQMSSGGAMIGTDGETSVGISRTPAD
jgi:hypothetical protein